LLRKIYSKIKIDYVCGIKSNIPACCVMWYLLGNIFRVITQYFDCLISNMTKKARAQYFRCPLCLLIGKVNELKTCKCYGRIGCLPNEALSFFQEMYRKGKWYEDNMLLMKNSAMSETIRRNIEKNYPHLLTGYKRKFARINGKCTPASICYENGALCYQFVLKENPIQLSPKVFTGAIMDFEN
jgi:hypothetical protein